ncbi:uncharacterized protein [Typha latifolia]|uniref:uncharacterized protein isoform X2 n=1 Tax=Typha latifolia TaxID=4733 RepID=UPI003C2F7029
MTRRKKKKMMMTTATMTKRRRKKKKMMTTATMTKKRNRARRKKGRSRRCPCPLNIIGFLLYPFRGQFTSLFSSTRVNCFTGKPLSLRETRKMGTRPNLGTADTSILSNSNVLAGKNIRKRLFFPPSLPVAEPGAAGSADISLLSSLNESAGKGIRKRLVLPWSPPIAKEDMRPTIGDKDLETVALINEPSASFLKKNILPSDEHVEMATASSEVSYFPTWSILLRCKMKMRLIALLIISNCISWIVRRMKNSLFPCLKFTHEELLDRSLDELESSAFLSFLRLVTSLEICKREDFYKPFLGAMKQQSMIEYCQEEVFPMGIEVDNVHIIALSNALRVPIRLENLDTSLLSGTVQLNHHDFTPELISTSSTVSDTLPSFSRKTCSSSTTSISAADPSRSSDAAEIHATDVRGTATLPEIGSSEKSGSSTSNISSSDQQVPYVILLYRPGHYDILYPK